MTGWFSPFLSYLARCTENELRRQIEFLKAENEMLRQRVPKKRIFLKREERERLLKLGTAIGSGVSKLITIVRGRTYQRWVQELHFRGSRGEGNQVLEERPQFAVLGAVNTG